MEAKEEIYQYIRKNIKEDGVTAQSIAEIFGIKRNVASHYLNLLEKEGKLQKELTGRYIFQFRQIQKRKRKSVII